MPNIKLADGTVRNRFRASLPTSQRGTFDDLVKMIMRPERCLEWYHRLGTLVRTLQEEVPGADTRSKRIEKLASALGPDDSLLMKAYRFVELYPTDNALKEVKESGADWTHLTLAFSIKDKQDRHALLEEAIRMEWSPRELLYQVQSRFPSRRRGVGGRDRTAIRDPEPSGVLGELLRRTDAWMDFYKETFKKMTMKGWKRLLKSKDPARSDWTHKILSDLADRLGDMSRNLRETTGKIRKLEEEL